MGGQDRIRWAPKLRTDRLVRLYESNAGGTLDAELVDEVGWRLWERLSDVILVTRGRVRCECGTEFQVQIPGEPNDTPRRCPKCGWTTTTLDWHASWEHRGLNGNCPYFERFVTDFPRATSVRERMILIDGAVHALHMTAKGEVSNFAARNFIEGSRPRIVALLEELALGNGSAVAEGARQRWEEARRRYRAGTD